MLRYGSVVALLAGLASCAPSPWGLKTGVSIVIDNDLQGFFFQIFFFMSQS
jgi:hypothetical protein